MNLNTAGGRSLYPASLGNVFEFHEYSRMRAFLRMSTQMLVKEEGAGWLNLRYAIGKLVRPRRMIAMPTMTNNHHNNNHHPQGNLMINRASNAEAVLIPGGSWESNVERA